MRWDWRKGLIEQALDDVVAAVAKDRKRFSCAGGCKRTRPLTRSEERRAVAWWCPECWPAEADRRKRAA